MALDLFRGIVRKTGPGLAMQEILYGFIMALIFVTAARIGVLHYSGRLELLLLIIGMNFTWGAIDAVVFYMVDVFNQRKFIRLMNNRGTKDRDFLIDRMLDEFSGTPLDILDPESEREICEAILYKELEGEDEIVKDRKAMRDSALACFLITVITLVPIVVPIALVDDINTGLMLASSFSAISLFFVGFRMERYIGINRWISGLMLTGVAWAITIVSTFTGG